MKKGFILFCFSLISFFAYPQWVVESSGTTNALFSTYFVDPNTGYIVGDNGTILKTIDGGGTGINESSCTPNSIKIYPNPSSDKITIETYETLAKGQLYIMNLSGQELLQQTITNPSTQIDISTLPSGVYVVKLREEKSIQVGKIIKE